MALETSVWALPTVAGGTVLGLIGAGFLDRLRDDEASESGGTNPLSDDAGYGGGGDGLSGDGFGGGTDLEAELGGGGAAGDGGPGGNGLGGGGGAGGGGGGTGGDPGADAGGDAGGGGDWGDSLDGGGGVDTLELERRVEELENDVDAIDATVSTVRSENESVQGTVEDIEEDIRNLLGIYEMVTQGVNPFADEVDGFDGNGFNSGGNETTLGLFEQGGNDATTDPEQDLEFEGSGNADPIDEDPPEKGSNEPTNDGIEPEPEAEPKSADSTETEPEPAPKPDPTAGRTEPDATADGTKSFSDLKAEYDRDGADTTATRNPGPVRMSTGSVPIAEPERADEPEPGTGAEPEPESTDSIDPKPEPDPEVSNSSADRVETERTRRETEDTRSADEVDDGFEYVDDEDLEPGRQDPYLRSLPKGYVGDLLVMEWLEYLVETATVTDAARAIRYYERIDWVSPSVAERLRDFLAGFGQVDRNVVVRPGTDELDRDHHTRSLRYIIQLNEATTRDVLVDRWDDLTDRALLPGGNPGENGPTAGDGPAPDDGHGMGGLPADLVGGSGVEWPENGGSGDERLGNGYHPHPPSPATSSDHDRPSKPRRDGDRDPDRTLGGVDRDATRPTSRRGSDGN
ncbi:flagellar protein FlaE/flagellar protein FlaC [Halopenitus malekzadehii]|uniref:Flagellar protein FlaE/flagellar protein FlaC n=1 Tax=Halopenitus malekzadehii TaxID=1267564 RepID=A0A1H6HRZ9_9EURY|nr:FlaD/FlaE family flagellar protein [Halopenitus malekzadehii]SEH38672.1 flagellar protein FlaE/flagellar protein FlaC [Halopenitus malekzadehii]